MFASFVELARVSIVLWSGVNPVLSIRSHMHMVKGSGSSATGGTVKYWPLDCTKRALPGLAQPLGPAASHVGADDDSMVRGPSRPDTSSVKLLGLKG
jgi:hypothetical protein